MTVASIARHPVAVGLILWAVSLAVVPAPLAARLWLGVPFVLVPRLAPALADGAMGGPLATRPWWSIGAGVFVAGAFMWPVGSVVAGCLVVPWLLLVLAALPRSVPGLGQGPRRSLVAVGRAASDLFLVVGAGSLLCERLGIAPLGFDPTIVLLTAVHFSVAGYGLIAESTIRAQAGSRAARWAVLALLVGIPATAVGWLVGTPIAAWPGTVLVAGGGLLAAASFAAAGRASRGWDRAPWMVSAVMLASGMVLAIGWSTALVLGTAYLDLSAMVRTHGVLNLVAVLLVAGRLPRTAAVADGPTELRRLRGGLVALGLALPVAAWIRWVPLDTLPSGVAPAVLAVAALVGPAIAGWVLADPPGQSAIDRVIRAAAMALAATLLAALVASTLAAADTPEPITALMGVGFLFIFGLAAFGPVALAASVPFAVTWVWATDHLGRRAAA